VIGPRVVVVSDFIPTLDTHPFEGSDKEKSKERIQVQCHLNYYITCFVIEKCKHHDLVYNHLFKFDCKRKCSLCKSCLNIFLEPTSTEQQG